jgi:hypothetical protein
MIAKAFAPFSGIKAFMIMKIAHAFAAYAERRRGHFGMIFMPRSYRRTQAGTETRAVMAVGTDRRQLPSRRAPHRARENR